MKKYLFTLLLLSLFTQHLVHAAYHLQPGDTIDIDILTKKDLHTKQPITPDGTVSLPLIGRLFVQGKTLPELDTLLQTQFSTYIQTPQIVTIITPTEEHMKASSSAIIYVALKDAAKHTIEVRKTESAAEAFAYTAGQPYTVTRATQNLGTTTNIQAGDIVTISIGNQESFLQKNWYKVLTGTAVGLGIYNSIR